MIDPNNLCMGCMGEQRGDGPCPRCGFSLKEYEETRKPRVLPAYTILNGKYLLGKVLGEGGFGITYLAYDLNLLLPIAIKEYFPVGITMRDTREKNTISVSLVSSSFQQAYENGLERFRTEAITLAKFQDMEGIVSVRNFFYENSTGYLVMEYIHGESLRKYLKKSRIIMKEEETLELMRPLLETLAKVHKEGIIHRDISPDNIMLSENGRVCLIDFGSARVATGAEIKTMTIQLKHGYAPVEQYQTKGRQGPWTDVYAVCATMYRMLTGRIPDASTDRAQNDCLPTLEELSLQSNELDISSGTSRTIAKGLAVSAEDRYQSIEELMKDLYRAKNDRDDPGQKKDSGTHGSRGRKKNGMLNTVSLAACILCFVFVMVSAAGAVLWKTGMLEKLKNTFQEPVGKIQEFLHISSENTDSDLGFVPSSVQETETSAQKVYDEKNKATVVMASVSSSDFMDGDRDDTPFFMFDDDRETVWKEKSMNGIIRGEFDREYKVEYLAFRLGDWKNSDSYHASGRPKSMKIRLGNNYYEVSFPDTYEEYYLEIKPAADSSSIALEIKDAFPGVSREDICITDIIIYGE